MLLALEGAQRSLERDAQGQRYLAWHILLPHWGKKKPPSLAEFMGLKPAPTAPQTAEDIQAIMATLGNGLIKRTYPPGYTGPR